MKDKSIYKFSVSFSLDITPQIYKYFTSNNYFFSFFAKIFVNGGKMLHFIAILVQRIRLFPIFDPKFNLHERRKQ